jgi:hypothetical protein
MDMQEKIEAKLAPLLDGYKQALLRLLCETYTSGFEDGQVQAYEKTLKLLDNEHKSVKQ